MAAVVVAVAVLSHLILPLRIFSQRCFHLLFECFDSLFTLRFELNFRLKKVRQN